MSKGRHILSGYKKRSFAKVLKPLLFLGVLIVLLPVITFSCLHVIPNNHEISQLRRSFRDIGLPQGAKKIGEYNYVGYLYGAGTKCDLVVSMLISTGADAKEPGGFYGGKRAVIRKKNLGSKIYYGKYYQGEVHLNDDWHQRFGSTEALLSGLNPRKKCDPQMDCYVVYATVVSSYHYDYRCF